MQAVSHDSERDLERLCQRISELEFQLRQAQRLEAIGTLAGGISHDFNNVLFLIVGYTEMCLERMIENAAERRYMEKILDAANRAKSLVRQIQAFTRSDEEEKRPVQIQFILNESMKLLRAAIPPDIEIRQKIDKSCPPVLADPIRIRQVMTGLCARAFDSMKEAGGLLEVRLEKSDLVRLVPDGSGEAPSGRFVRLTVGDSGPGLDPKVPFRLFLPDSEPGKPIEEAGFSLSVIQQIVADHGGYMTLYSEPGEGATFHIYLPVDAPEKKAAEPVCETVLQGTERILLVDDEPDVLSMVRQMLESLGYRIVTRMNGAEAFDLFQSDPDRFDLVATDLSMPGMSGAELAREILVLRPDMPIVLMSGLSEFVSREKTRDIGIQQFVTKPAAWAEIAGAVRRALDPA